MYAASTISKSPSILKKFDPAAKTALIKSRANQVRFENPKLDVKDILEDVIHNSNIKEYEKLLFILRNDIADKVLYDIIEDSKKSISLLTQKLSTYVEALISVNWLEYNEDVQASYKSFVIDLLITHNIYTKMIYSNLVSYLVPKDDEQENNWHLGCPPTELMTKYNSVFELLSNLLDVVPMSNLLLVDEVKRKFPYFRKSSVVVSGYVFNLLNFLRIRPLYEEDILEIIFNKLLVLDVNVPRDEIEAAEDLENEELAAKIFNNDNCDTLINDEDLMHHPLARTLDYCMNHIFNFIDEKVEIDTNCKKKILRSEIYDILTNLFHKMILTTHNSHHLQFFIFYLCSLKDNYSDNFIRSLWRKFCEPNVAPSLRHAAISYLASMLARGKFIPMKTIKEMLNEFCVWAHQYIQRSEAVNCNQSLLAHTVFYSVCQAIFYIIAFRSKDLVSCKKGILFLESLQLSTLVTCSLNPLRVCLPTIATAFASITRIYQLAYCHPILERNARRQLTTIYTNDSQKPEDCLDTFFPFDPYLLKISNEKIDSIYLQYQANDADEGLNESHSMKRKRMISMSAEDEFVLDEEKCDLAKRIKQEINCPYGNAPGFHQ